MLLSLTDWRRGVNISVNMKTVKGEWASLRLRTGIMGKINVTLKPAHDALQELFGLLLGASGENRPNSM